MKYRFFFPLLALLGSVALFQACKTQKGTRSGDTVYACPMHPEITGKMGGHCSKCKMDLTKTAATPMCCCPKHKECMGKMGEKCPKCSTPLEELREAYICPMHADQVGKKGDKCPKCKMDMVPREKVAEKRD